MGHCLAAAPLEWKPWLSSIQGLDLTLLITGKNQRMFGRVEIKPDDVFEFFLKPFIVGKLEAGHPMRLQTVRRPDAPDTGLADARGLRYGGSTPVCGSLRQLVECHLHNARTGRGCNRWDASRTGLILPLEMGAQDAELGHGFSGLRQPGSSDLFFRTSRKTWRCPDSIRPEPMGISCLRAEP